MTILFDFDEVIVDINTNALHYINERLKTNYVLEDVKTWDFYDNPAIRPTFLQYLAIPDLYQNYAIPNNQMIGVIKQLMDSGEDVYIVTASEDESHKSKLKFIEDHMSFFDKSKVFKVNSNSKYKYKSDILDDIELNYHEPIVLIDDGLHNILDMMADVKHKEDLDGMMSKLYNIRRLNKFNNPYHDFIYGITLTYPWTENIETGKRLFKIKEADEIWKKIKHIRKNHTNRISQKQNEIFFYFNELLDVYLNEENKNSNDRNKIIQNTKYLNDYYLYNNEHKSFINKLTEIVIKSKDLTKNNLEKIISRTDKIYGNDIMYQDIKSLIEYHLEMNNNGVKNAKFYGLIQTQQDLFAESIINKLTNISIENINYINSDYNKQFTDGLLKEKKLYSEDNLEYKANLLKSLNDDLEVKDNLVERNHSLDKKFKFKIK